MKVTTAHPPPLQFTPSRRKTSASSSPSTATRLSRPVSPDSNDTERLGTPRVSEKNSNSSAFARPPSGTAFNFTFTAPPIMPATAVFEAFGTARMRMMHEGMAGGSPQGFLMSNLRRPFAKIPRRDKLCSYAQTAITMKIHITNLIAFASALGAWIAANPARLTAANSDPPTSAPVVAKHRGLDPELVAPPKSFAVQELSTDPAAPSAMVSTDSSGFATTVGVGPTRTASRAQLSEDPYWSKYSLQISPSVTLRPIGGPRGLPNCIGTGFPDQPGPALASGIEWRPDDYFRMGVDVMMRTERVDLNYRSNSWAAYVVPAMEYTPAPQSETPVSIGLAAPLAIGGDSTGGDPSKSGLFLYMRVRW